MSDQASSPPVEPLVEVPDGPRTPEEAAEDAEILDRWFSDPEAVAFVRRIAKHKSISLAAAVQWSVKYSANRHKSLDRYESTSRCETVGSVTGCKKKIERCVCSPATIAARVAAREAAERAADAAFVPSDADIAERRAQRAAAKGGA